MPNHIGHMRLTSVCAPGEGDQQKGVSKTTWSQNYSKTSVVPDIYAKHGSWMRMVKMRPLFNWQSQLHFISLASNNSSTIGGFIFQGLTEHMIVLLLFIV